MNSQGAFTLFVFVLGLRQACGAISAVELADDMVIGVAYADVFDATQNLQGIAQRLASMDAAGVERDLYALDLFAGQCAIRDAFLMENLPAVGMDVKFGGALHNLLTHDGFWHTAKTAMRVKPFGLCMAGPPCSHFVWLSQSWHRRSETTPEGDTTRLKICMSNLLVSNFIVILALLAARQVFFCIEQPSTSKLWLHYAVKSFLAWQDALKVSSWMGCFGHDLPKPSQHYCNFADLLTLKRIWSKARARAWAIDGDVVWSEGYRLTHHAGDKGEHVIDTSYHKRTSDGKWVSGTKKLASSAAYTPAFAAAVVAAWWKAHMAAFADVESKHEYEEAFHLSGLSSSMALLFHNHVGPAADALKRRPPLFKRKREASTDEPDCVVTDPYM